MKGLLSSCKGIFFRPVFWGVRSISIKQNEGYQITEDSLKNTRLAGYASHINNKNWTDFQAEINRKALRRSRTQKELIDLITVLDLGSPLAIEDLRGTPLEGQEVGLVKPYEVLAALCREVLKMNKNNSAALGYLAKALEKGAKIELGDLQRTEFEGQTVETLGYIAQRKVLPAQLRALSEQIGLSVESSASAILISDILPPRAPHLWFTPAVFETVEQLMEIQDSGMHHSIRGNLEKNKAENIDLVRQHMLSSRAKALDVVRPTIKKC